MQHENACDPPRKRVMKNQKQKLHIQRENVLSNAINVSSNVNTFYATQKRAI